MKKNAKNEIKIGQFVIQADEIQTIKWKKDGFIFYMERDLDHVEPATSKIGFLEHSEHDPNRSLKV